MSVSKTRLLFFVRRIGPYHHARFRAAADRFDLTVVETRSDSQEYPWEFTPSHDYRILKFPSGNDGIRGAQLNSAVEQAFESSRPAVVVTTGWADPEYHVVVLEAQRRNIPRVFVSDSRYEDEPRKFYKELLKKMIVRSYQSCIVAGTASRRYVTTLGMNPQAIFQPWDVVDNENFTSQVTRSASFSERYFLCVSRFIAKKNLPRLIAAFAAYRSEGGKRRLVLLGSGELQGELEQLVDAAALRDAVAFNGFVQYEGLPAFFSKALCLILPSTSDQWGLVVNEAMASGLPVLVSRACGCAVDIVEDGANGYTFDPVDTGSITKAMWEIDNVGEQRWSGMSNRSLEIISKWKPSDFATALAEAATFAVNSEHSRSFLFLHRLLGSRR